MDYKQWQEFFFTWKININRFWRLEQPFFYLESYQFHAFKARFFLFLSILLVCFALSYKYATLPYLFNDEAQNVFESYKLILESRYVQFISQNRESSLAYIQGFLTQFFGFKTEIIRLPTLILSNLAFIGLVLLLFQNLPSIAAFALSSFLISNHYVLENVRTGLRMSAGLSIIMLVVCFGFQLHKAKIKGYFFYGFLVGIGFHTYHNYRIFPMVIGYHLVMLLIEKNPNFNKKTFLSFMFGLILATLNIIFFLLFDPLRILYFHRETSDFNLKRSIELVFENFNRLLNIFLSDDVCVNSVNKHMIFIFVFCLFLASFFSSIKKKNFTFTTLHFLGLLYLCPGFLTDMTPRRVLPSIVFIPGLAFQYFLNRLSLSRWNKVLLPATCSLLLMFGLGSLFAFFTKEQVSGFPSQQFAAEFLAENVSPSDVIIISDEIHDNYILQNALIRTNYGDLFNKHLNLNSTFNNNTDLLGGFCKDQNGIYVVSVATPPNEMDFVEQKCGKLTEIPFKLKGSEMLHNIRFFRF